MEYGKLCVYRFSYVLGPRARVQLFAIIDAHQRTVVGIQLFLQKRYYNHTSAVLTLQILLRQGHLCIQRNHWTREDIDVARKCFRRCSRNIMAELRTRLKPLIHPKLRLKADYTGISDIPSLHPSIVLGTADEKYDRTERACNRCGR